MSIIFFLAFFSFIFLLIISITPNKKPNLKGIINHLNLARWSREDKFLIVKHLVNNIPYRFIYYGGYNEIIKMIKQKAPLFSNIYCCVYIFAQTRTGKFRIVNTVLFYNFDSNYFISIIEALFTKFPGARHPL